MPRSFGLRDKLTELLHAQGRFYQVLPPHALNYDCRAMLLWEFGCAICTYTFLNANCCIPLCAVLITIKKHAVESLDLGQCPENLPLVLVALATHTVESLYLSRRRLFQVFLFQIMALLVSGALPLHPISLCLNNVLGPPRTERALNKYWSYITGVSDMPPRQVGTSVTCCYFCCTSGLEKSAHGQFHLRRCDNACGWCADRP